MSSIPKGKRSESRLEALHIMMRIRKQITNEVLKSFDLTEKQKDAHVRTMVRYIDDNYERAENRILLYKLESDPQLWLFEQERESLLKYCRDAYICMIQANSIYMETEKDYETRRAYWSKAQSSAIALCSELQYLCEALPKDKNRLMQVVLDIDKVIALIKGLKKSDKKTWNKLAENK